MLEDYDDLLDQISPRHYRQFRMLYNELLGYIERDEIDKIKAFSYRIDASIQQAYNIQSAIQRRLHHFQRQQYIGIKNELYRRFRTPKKTVTVTHLFPLKQPRLISESPMPTDAKASSSKPATAKALDQDQKLADLMRNMAEYDKEKQVDLTIDQAVNAGPNVEKILDQPDDSIPAGHVIKDELPLSDDPTQDGVSLSDSLEDQSLYIKKKQSRDILRAKKTTKKPPSSSSKRPASNAANVPLTDKERKERIWDYIDNDSSSGGIDHDL